MEVLALATLKDVVRALLDEAAVKWLRLVAVAELLDKDTDELEIGDDFFASVMEDEAEVEANHLRRSSGCGDLDRPGASKVLPPLTHLCSHLCSSSNRVLLAEVIAGGSPRLLQRFDGLGGLGVAGAVPYLFQEAHHLHLQEPHCVDLLLPGGRHHLHLQ